MKRTLTTILVVASLTSACQMHNLKYSHNTSCSDFCNAGRDMESVVRNFPFETIVEEQSFRLFEKSSNEGFLYTSKDPMWNLIRDGEGDDKVSEAVYTTPNTNLIINITVRNASVQQDVQSYIGCGFPLSKLRRIDNIKIQGDDYMFRVVSFLSEKGWGTTIRESRFYYNFNALQHDKMDSICVSLDIYFSGRTTPREMLENYCKYYGKYLAVCQMCTK